MNRREALGLIVTGGVSAAALVLGGCGMSSPTAPDSGPSPGNTTVSLLIAVRNQGFNAQRVAYGNSGAARIGIDGDINWNFLVNDSPVGIGSNSVPSLDVSAFAVPNTARVTVRRP